MHYSQEIRLIQDNNSSKAVYGTLWPKGMVKRWGTRGELFAEVRWFWGWDTDYFVHFLREYTGALSVCVWCMQWPKMAKCMHAVRQQMAGWVLDWVQVASLCHVNSVFSVSTSSGRSLFTQVCTNLTDVLDQRWAGCSTLGPHGTPYVTLLKSGHKI